MVRGTSIRLPRIVNILQLLLKLVSFFLWEISDVFDTWELAKAHIFNKCSDSCCSSLSDFFVPTVVS